MDRRKFLRGSGMVAGALGGLVLGYREYVNKPIIDKKVLDQVEGGHNCLTITQGYYPKPKPVAITAVPEFDDFDDSLADPTLKFKYVKLDQSNLKLDQSNFIFRQEDQYQLMSNVSFKPGPDGNLYLKINGEWKQVLTS